MKDKMTRASIFICEQMDIISILSYIYEQDKQTYNIIRRKIMNSYIKMEKENYYGNSKK